MDDLWLPEGHHWSLHIEHQPAGAGAGAFTGGGWKLCWHITVSPWQSVDSVIDTVTANHDEPHFVIGGRPGREHPTVVQLLPLSEAGRSLEHTEAPQTNRANVIQVEICAEPDEVTARLHRAPFTDVVAHWPDARYKALANLAGLIDHRVPIERKLARRFVNTKRFTNSEFQRAKGHLGHMHVPQQTHGHTDPTTAFEGSTLMKYLKEAPNAL
jgi:hypothetical protein